MANALMNEVACVKLCLQKVFLKNEKSSSRLLHSLNRLLAEVRFGGRPISAYSIRQVVNQSGVGICTGKFLPHQYGNGSLHPDTPARWWKKSYLHPTVEKHEILQSIFRAADGFGKPILLLPTNFFGHPAGPFSDGREPEILEILSKGIFVLVRNMYQNISHELYLTPLPVCSRDTFAVRRNKSGVYIYNNQPRYMQYSEKLKIHSF